MIGNFISIQACISHLETLNYVYYLTNNGHETHIKRMSTDTVTINTYRDGSASYVID